MSLSSRLRLRLYPTIGPEFSRRTFVSPLTLTSSDPHQLFDKLDSHLSSQSSADRGLPSATLLSFSQDLYPHLSPSISSLLSSPSTLGALVSSPSSADPGTHSLSIARFYNTPSTSYVPFRSSAKGNAPASVGRWRPLGEVPWEVASDGKEMGKAFEGGDWSRIWEQASSVEGDDGKNHVELMTSLEGLEGVEPESVRSVLAFSTPSSTSIFLRDLSQQFPCAMKAGSIVPKTPFTTGLDHTLFYNGQQHEDGAIGIAVVEQASSASAAPALQVDWARLEPLGEDVFSVSQSQGNLLLGLSSSSASEADTTRNKSNPSSSTSSNPTQHLLRLLRLSSSPDLHNAQIGKAWLGGKEKDFYVGFLRDGQTGDEKVQVQRVVKVLSGDPSRGGMALDTEESIKSGEKFIFLHQPSSPTKASINDLSSTIPSPGSSISFSFRTSSISPPLTSSQSTDDVEVEEGSFVSSSEAGFLFGQADESGCMDSGVPGGSARVLLLLSHKI